MSLSNHVQYMSTAAHGHQSNYQGQTGVLRHENDIEKRIQAKIAKDGVRIREFFIDFDKLRKGVVGEAAVSDKRTVMICQRLPAQAAQTASRAAPAVAHRTIPTRS